LCAVTDGWLGIIEIKQVFNIIANLPREPELWAFWEKINVPVLVLHGAISDVLTPEVAAR
jgi:pimeloyl-ACP methyl ester carboxylesterase